MHVSRKVAPAALLALMLTATACGSDDGADGGSGGSGGDGPLKVHVIASLESPTWSVPQVQVAVESAIAEINDDGGIDGRQIEASFCNDKFDANEAAACAQRAVADEVVAILAPTSPNTKAIGGIAAQAGIPMIGPGGGDGVAESADDGMYPINAGSSAFVLVAGAVAVQKGGPKLVGITQDTSSAVDSMKNVAPIAVEAAGGEIVKEIITPNNIVDFAAPAATAIQENPDAILFTQGAEWGARMIDALRSAGYQGPITGPASMLNAGSIDALGDKAQNVYVGSRGLPSTYVQNEAIAEFQEQMTAADPSVDADDIALNAWMSVAFFRQVIEGHDITDGQSVIEALDAVTEDDPIDLRGVYPDWPGLADPPHEEYPRVAVFKAGVIKVENGELIPEGDFVDPLAG